VNSALKKEAALAAGEESACSESSFRRGKHCFRRTFFITSSIAGRRALLQTERSAGLLIEILYHYRGQGKYRLHEFVVMPEHFHLLLTVGSDLSIEKALQFVKGGFAFRGGKEFGFLAPVWQHGFADNRVRDVEQFFGYHKYIRENPVKRGLASAASDFPFSSAHEGFELDPIPQGLKPESIEA
jgi:putative transposase